MLKCNACLSLYNVRDRWLLGLHLAEIICSTIYVDKLRDVVHADTDRPNGEHLVQLATSLGSLKPVSRIDYPRNDDWERDHGPGLASDPRRFYRRLRYVRTYKHRVGGERAKVGGKKETSGRASIESQFGNRRTFGKS